MHLPSRDGATPRRAGTRKLLPGLAGLACLWLAGCGGGGVAAPEVVNQPPVPVAIPRASITPAELGVVIIQGDALSESIGVYYQAARGIPDENVVRIALPSGRDEITAAEFSAAKAQLDARLPARVQATLLSWAQPSRVRGACAMSITSAFAFGYDAKYCVVQGNGCVPTAASPYYNIDTTKPWQDLNLRPSMMLGASSLNAARALIDRGVRADRTYPAGAGYLLRTSDHDRSVRADDYPALPALWNVAGGLKLNYIDNSANAAADFVAFKPDVLFYFTGLVSVPQLNTNTFVPGAAADHLTSYGGFLPEAPPQMPITAWIEAGATASYGTVDEPCNFTSKFPQASIMIEQYFRGATLIEAYWKSVQWPGQGLFIGEPLARPFLDDATSTIVGNEFVITTRQLRRNSRYSVEYRASSQSPWVELASVVTAQPKQQTLRAPLPPAGSNEVRFVGPCPTNPSLQCALGS